MSTAVSYLPSAGQPQLADIHRIFERQRETALRLRTATPAERQAASRAAITRRGST